MARDIPTGTWRKEGMWGMQCRVKRLLGRQGVVDKEDRPRERQDQGNEVRESATGRVFLKAEMERTVPAAPAWD